MKTVLMLTYAYYPMFHGGVPRVAKFCKYLSRFGWTPILVTYDSSDIATKSQQITMAKDTCEVIRVKAPLRLPKKTKCSLLRKCTLFLNALRFGEDTPFVLLEDAMLKAAHEICKTRKIDVIFASSLPQFVHRIAHKLSSAHGIPWVADHRDIIGQTKRHSRGALSGFAHYLIDCFAICRDTIYDRSASRIIIASEGAAVKLRRRTRRQVDVIMNGYDDDDFAGHRIDRKNVRMTIVYTGSLFGNPDITVFFAGLMKAIENMPELHEGTSVHFYGPCCDAVEQYVQRLASKALSDVVHCCGQIPHEKAISVICSADILYLISFREKGIVTGKIFEYLAAGKTILSVPGDEDITDEIISKSNAGYVARTPDEVARFLMDKYEEWKTNGALSLSPNMEYIASFSRRKETEQLANILNQTSRKMKIDQSSID